MTSARIWLILLWTFSAALVPFRLEATIYSFVDDKGVLHFTNVPNDSRYRPLRDGQARALRMPWHDKGLEPIIQRTARRFAVDPHLVRAVIKAESNFDPQAVSAKGAMGLMQLMPGTARDMEVRDPFDPEENIWGGTRYLSQLLDFFQGDLDLTLAAYNSGPDRVSRLGRVPEIPETREYVSKVLSHYRQYRQRSAP